MEYLYFLLQNCLYKFKKIINRKKTKTTHKNHAFYEMSYYRQNYHHNS